MLSMAGPCFVGGNIGKSLLAELPQMNERSNVVLELSSYMLHWLGAMRWSPSTAVVTMLGLDHVEWHGGAEAYMDAKRHIARFQKPGDRLVRRDDELSRTFPLQPGVSLLTYPDDALPRFELSMPGEHNQHNAQAAFLAACGAGVDFDAAQRAVRNLRGLPHRLELVHESNRVRFYNDSIATIPEAAIIACDAFEPGSVIQIIGGYPKPGLSWNAMCEHLAGRCKAVLTIGQIGEELAARCRDSGGRTVEVCETLDRAVARAKELALPGEVVLLSPGTASYGQFFNFEKRGEAFAQFARGE
jgi:UDP-N-acetylmuramoylalanine--D-glutamate ligase